MPAPTRDVYFFNTLTRAKEKFIPLVAGKASLYTCGPTVYHYAHIGNLRTYVFEDLLTRTLRYAGFDLTHVMNITDVGHLVSDGDEGEDKMEKGARREGKSAWDIARYYTEIFFQDLDKLNIVRPQIVPKATEHVTEMIELVQDLEKRGFVYQTDDGVYYDTSRFPSYGNLAQLDVENLEAGKRVSMGEKKRPTDFALWKFSPAGEKRQMEWDSPWGKGFPGWHIECSAMAMKYLGPTFDLHCGGKDHIPVHHTNEIAQSEAATGKKYVNYWMHSAFLNEDSGKMSKSTGKILTLSAVEEEGFTPLDYRYLLLQAHYRSELSFSWDSLKAAAAGLRGLRERVQALGEPAAISAAGEVYRQKFWAAIADDLGSAEALAVLFGLLKDPNLAAGEKKALVLDFDRIFGLRLDAPALEAGLPAEIQALVDARDAARKAKDFAESDRLRDALQAAGYAVKDSPQGTKVVKR